MKDRENIVKHTATIIKRFVPTATTILFGSQARGEARPDSDIDLLILIPDQQKRDYNQIRSQLTDELYSIELESGILISPLILTHSMWSQHSTPFTHNVAKDGIIL